MVAKVGRGGFYRQGRPGAETSESQRKRRSSRVASGGLPEPYHPNFKERERLYVKERGAFALRRNVGLLTMSKAEGMHTGLALVINCGARTGYLAFACAPALQA